MNKSTLIKILTLGFTTLMTVSTVTAGDTSIAHKGTTASITLEASAIELRNKLKKYKQFSASFNQQVIDNKGREIQQATGLMKMRQPNQFNWVTNEPDESTVISDGSSVWIYNPFVEQVTALSLNSTMAKSPLWLIANQSDSAWADFTVEKLMLNSDNKKPKVHSYSVIPKDNKNITREIIMTFDDNIIDNLVIKDAQGQISIFTFADFDYQTIIDNTYFSFELPAGVDFDDQREAK